jgi:ribosomal protein S18 acetylase RimI-like enzyme
MIVYGDTIERISADQLSGGFFDGWLYPLDPETHLRLLQGSDVVVIALDDESKQIVGFITAITDGVLAAYIPLLEVLPPYRDQGIGSELLRRMLNHLERYGVVDLLCDLELQPWYRRFGMHPASGMLLRKPPS